MSVVATASAMRAYEDPSLSAIIRSRKPMVYRAGADLGTDRPAHVRAASGLAWLGGKLVAIQDDANFLAFVDPRDGACEVSALPAGPDGRRQFDESRGTKHLKLDLEACLTLRVEGVEQLLAFGSGSSPRRESIVCVRSDRACEASVYDAQPFYAALRANRHFSGSELNLEGVALRGEQTLLLFQRGNGRACDGLRAIDATAEVELHELLAHLSSPGTLPAPALRNVVEHDLGMVSGVRLTFTDATRGPLNSVFFLASAEASPDAIRDGEVVGSAVGLIDGQGRTRYSLLVDEKGRPSRDKIEGIALDPNDANLAWISVDRDEPHIPSELLAVELMGPWSP